MRGRRRTEIEPEASALGVNWQSLAELIDIPQRRHRELFSESYHHFKRHELICHFPSFSTFVVRRFHPLF